MAGSDVLARHHMIESAFKLDWKYTGHASTLAGEVGLTTCPPWSRSNSIRSGQAMDRFYQWKWASCTLHDLNIPVTSIRNQEFMGFLL